MALNSAFLKDLVERLPEADRGVILSVLEKDTAADAVKFAEDGAKRQSEFSRSMDEGRRALSAKQQELDDAVAAVNAKAEEQRTWYDANKAALDAGWKALSGKDPKPGAGDDPPADPAALPPDLVRRADLEKYITEREMGAAQYINAVSTLTLKHFHEFGEVLDINTLMRDPKLKELGLLGVYDATVADRRREAAKKAEDDRINKTVEERLAAERRKGIPPPYPVSAQDVSPLSALTSAESQPGVVDEATNMYHDLVQQRSAREAATGVTP